MANPGHSTDIDLSSRHSYEEPADNDFCDEISSSNDKTERSQKMNLFCSSINFKQLLIEIIGGSFLTLLIVVPAVYFSSKANCGTANTTTCGKDNEFQLKFDRCTLHLSTFISMDGLTLSNIYSKDTPVTSLKKPSSLKVYRGVVGNRCVEQNSKFYFEVQYQLTLVGKLNPGLLILEVGLATRETVDNYHYIGTTRTRGWSYIFQNCRQIANTTCLTAGHNNRNIFEEIPLHQSRIGTKQHGTFGFIVNANQQKFSIVLNLSTGVPIIHSFKNVFSTQRLCPVFAVYNPSSFGIKVTLRNTYEFSGAVWNAVVI